MALSTYSGLKDSVAKWLWRDGEANTEAAIPDMIRLAESRFNRVIRCADMETVDPALEATDGVATLPGAFRQMKSLRTVDAPDYPITYRPIDQMEALLDTATGGPRYWTRVGSELHLWPRVTTTLRMRYREEITPLSDGNTSNWLLAKHPDVYLNMTLAAGEAFGFNDNRIAVWKQLAEEAIAEINSETVSVVGDRLQVSPGVTVI